MRIAVFFGGESVEHEISIISASQVIRALSLGYNVIPVYISKDNKMYCCKGLDNLKTYTNLSKIIKKKNEIMVCREGKQYYLKRNFKKFAFDYAFPIVHGKGMEDGTLLAYLKFLKIPVIGDNLSFYSVAQNKVLTKRILDSLNIKNSRYEEFSDIRELNEIMYPVVVKPNCLGSSIGVKKANNYDELSENLRIAFMYDRRVIVEEFIEDALEYNISVLEKNGEIIVSDIEEVIKDSDVLDYKQKYEKGKKSEGMASASRVFPAKIDEELKKKMEAIAKVIYKRFNAKGVIRIDFLYSDELYVNEINAIPGSYSYYLWKNKMDFVELLDCVIDTAKRDNFKDNKLIKSIEKMTIFDNYKGSKLKG